MLWLIGLCVDARSRGPEWRKFPCPLIAALFECGRPLSLRPREAGGSGEVLSNTRWGTPGCEMDVAIWREIAYVVATGQGFSLQVHLVNAGTVARGRHIFSTRAKARRFQKH